MQLNSNTEKQIIEWIDNVIGVPTKELGLLAGDGIRRWRISNQLKTLSKAIEKSKKLNLPLKVISPKLICPLLENCSLEDDDFMQDKWANLLTNMLDSEQNVQNHVFPFILSQVSKNEFTVLEHQYNIYSIWYQEKTIQNIEVKEGSDYKETLDKFQEQIQALYNEARSNSIFRTNNILQFEIENAKRLGLINSIQLNKAKLINEELVNEVPSVVVGETGFEYVFTELGELFFKACAEKQDAKSK